ncbi:MAG: hypothetical protein ABJC26_08545 [Gemmatimonadaceae bacterium]
MTDSTPRTALVRSKRNRIVRAVGAAAAVAALSFAAACSSDSVTAPEMNRSNGAITNLLTGLTGTLNHLINVTGLLRVTTLSSPIVRSAVITQKGGKIEIKELGFELDIPAGAIPTSSMTITVTALAGSAVAYDFQPHGTKFLKPLSIRQDLKGSNWDKVKVKCVLSGGYFKDLSQVNLLQGTAQLDETFPVVLESSRVSFDIMHFSGYMVATGRSADASANAELN